MEDTNIWIAAGDGQLDLVQAFIDGGVDVNAQDETGYSALHAAASYANADVLRYLLSKGGDVNLVDEDGDTPLHVCEDPTCAAALIDAGADITKPNNEGLVPYQVAYREFWDDMVSYLVTLYAERGLQLPLAERLMESDEVEDDGTGEGEGEGEGAAYEGKDGHAEA